MSTSKMEIAPTPAIQSFIGMAVLPFVMPAKIAQAVGAEVRGATMARAEFRKFFNVSPLLFYSLKCAFKFFKCFN